MENSVNEQQLLSRVTAGDRNAFCIIYRRYWLELYDAAYQRLKNTAQAEDIIQDVFTRLWLRRRDLNIANLPAYLHTAVRYKVYNYVARNAVARNFYEPFEAIVACSPSADAAMIEQELLHLIDAYIDTLPKKRRQIFTLYFKENLSTKEIAARLKVSQKTVQNQLGTAIHGLRIKLAPTIMLILLLYCF